MSLYSRTPVVLDVKAGLTVCESGLCVHAHPLMCVTSDPTGSEAGVVVRRIEDDVGFKLM